MDRSKLVISNPRDFTLLFLEHVLEPAGLLSRFLLGERLETENDLLVRGLYDEDRLPRLLRRNGMGYVGRGTVPVLGETNSYSFRTVCPLSELKFHLSAHCGSSRIGYGFTKQEKGKNGWCW